MAIHWDPCSHSCKGQGRVEDKKGIPHTHSIWVGPKKWIIICDLLYTCKYVTGMYGFSTNCAGI